MNETKKQYCVEKKNLEHLKGRIKSLSSLTLEWDFKMPNRTYVLSVSGKSEDIDKLNKYYKKIKNAS